MGNPSRIKQLSSAHAHLLFAKGYVSLQPPGMPRDHVGLAEVERALSEQELVSWMDALAACGVQETPRGGFWRDMQRAAEALGQAERATTYGARFLAALGSQTREGGAHDL